MLRFTLGILAAGLALAQPSPKASGNPNAPLTIEVFSDFECPSCKVLHESTLKDVKRDYVAKGKAYILHRDFPLQQHKFAREAACLANASARLNKYDKVCDALFARQQEWSKSGNLEPVLAQVLTPAELKRVTALAKDPSIKAEIDRDVSRGMENKVNQTPTMWITHKGRSYPVAGAVQYSILRRFLDQLLSN